MINRANNAARRLWKDESGVVLAFTMVVFLTLFVMALSVYALGETVRLRVEVQNAADSAAYSAAIVQADNNSRIAALNRAMSWCYVQMVRMQMDYIVDKWLEETVDSWGRDNDIMDGVNMAGECNHGQPYYGTGYGVFLYNTSNHKKVMLNKHQLVGIDEINDARDEAQGQGKDYHSLAGPIELCWQNIRDMNAKEVELLNALPGRIHKTVEEILKANISDTWNDSFAGGGGIGYTLYQCDDPKTKTFRIMKGNEEDDFLRHSDYIPEQGSTSPEVFGTGSYTGQWFNLKGDGLQREYVQRSSMLIAEWSYFTSAWYYDFWGDCDIPVIIPNMDDSVRGEDVWDEHFTTELAEPYVVSNIFFCGNTSDPTKGGAIVVGVSRKVTNPFQFMAVGGKLGIVSPFTLDNGNRFMWTAAAAIAGYNPKPREECNGRYEVTYEDNSGDKLWNLKTSDWDAELIPLHRAWTKGAGRAWTGESAGALLAKVKEGPWTAITAGGLAPGVQGGPELMNKGADVDYGGAEGLVVH